MYLLRVKGAGRFARHRAAWWPLMYVSLTLTSTAGLQAVVFWALRGDWSVAWGVPNLFLLLFPVPAIVLLMRQETGHSGQDCARTPGSVGIQSHR
ncbi:DUF5360 family protein [Streptomyces sp. NPDC054802]